MKEETKDEAIRRLTRWKVAKRAAERVKAEWRPLPIPWYDATTAPLAHSQLPPLTAWRLCQQATPMIEALQASAHEEGRRVGIRRRLVQLLSRVYPEQSEFAALADNWSEEARKAYVTAHPWRSAESTHDTHTYLASAIGDGKPSWWGWAGLAAELDRRPNPAWVAGQIRELFPEPPAVNDFEPRLAEYDKVLGWFVRYDDGSIWMPHDDYPLDEIEPDKAAQRMLRLARNYRIGCRTGCEREPSDEVKAAQAAAQAAAPPKKGTLTVTASLSRSFIDALYVSVLGQPIAKLVEDRTTSEAIAADAETRVYQATQADAPQLVGWLEITEIEQATSDLGSYRSATTCLPRANPAHKTELRRHLVDHLQWAVCMSTAQAKRGKGEAE